jgi:hypothetical protein
MNARVATSLLLVALWLGLLAYFLIRNELFRNPFSGNPTVAVLWLLVVLAVLWNLARAYYFWRPHQPPVRRHDG